MSYCFGFSILLITTLTIASSCFNTGKAQKLTLNHNEYCKPRPTLVAIDPPSFRRFPYYVTLQRCGGSAGYVSPRILTCEPATTRDVTIQVRNLRENGAISEVVEKNHTSCKQMCTDKPEICDQEMEVWNELECSCQCRYSSGPPEPCPARFKWNPYLCSCECNEEHAAQCIRQQKVWSHDKCGCECSPRVISRCKRINRVVDENTCRCVVGEVVFGAQNGNGEDKGVSKPLLFGIVIGELLLLLLIFDLILYMKGWGFIHYLGKSIGKAISRDKHNGNDPPLSPSLNHDRTTYL